MVWVNQFNKFAYSELIILNHFDFWLACEYLWKEESETHDESF